MSYLSIFIPQSSDAFGGHEYKMVDFPVTEFGIRVPDITCPSRELRIIFQLFSATLPSWDSPGTPLMASIFSLHIHWASCNSPPSTTIFSLEAVSFTRK